MCAHLLPSATAHVFGALAFADVFFLTQSWDAHWNWFTHTQASSHMFADGANEMFPAQGTYPFDQGHPNLGNYGA